MANTQRVMSNDSLLEVGRFPKRTASGAKVLSKVLFHIWFDFTHRNAWINAQFL